MLYKSITSCILLLACSYAQAGEICITAESDPDGDGFGWEQESTCLVTEASSRVPEFFDPRTGEKRNIQRLSWVRSDFAGKSFSDCQGYLVDPAETTDQCLTCGNGESYEYKHFEDGNGRLVYSRSQQREFASGRKVSQVTSVSTNNAMALSRQPCFLSKCLTP